MGLSDITLSGGMRSDLVQLQLVTALQNRTTERLATGKRVNSATDDPSAYFAAQDHLSHAGDLQSRKADMGEALKGITAANNGITAITSLIEQAKGLVTSARSSNTAGRATLATQFASIRTQIDQLAADSGYKGKNFLAGDDLAVTFNENGSSTLTITGFDASTGTGGLDVAAATNAWVASSDLDAAATDLDAALTELRSSAAALSANNSVISSRNDFVTNMINNLMAGANDLTASDPNEESANMLALQTRQQLGIATLGLANQAQQSILRLF
jgi:flagellin